MSLHTHRSDSHFTSLTVPVAGLSEGLPLGEDDGHSQVLEGGDVEEGGVLVVLDVFVVVRARYIQAVREAGAGGIAGAAGREKHKVTTNM